MSFLVLDGFDNYNFGDISAIDGWTGGGPPTVPGRLNGNALELIFANGISRALDPGFIGFAFQNNSNPAWFGTGGEIFFSVGGFPTCGDPANVCPGTPYIVSFKVGIGLDAANRPYVFTTGWSDVGSCPGHPTKCDKWTPNDTIFYGWGETPPLDYAEWNYLEINLQTLELRLNGGTIVTSSSTQTTPYGDIFSVSGIEDNLVAFQAPGINTSIWIDDFYAQDATGDFVGDIHIETLYPDADGHYTDWTPGPGGSGTDHYTRVDEEIFDGNESYNHDETAGHRDSYLMQAMSVSSGTIYAAQLSLAVAIDGVLDATIQPSIRQGGVDYDGPSLGLSAHDETGLGYWLASYISDTDPTGSAWTVSTVNGDEYGILLEHVDLP